MTIRLFIFLFLAIFSNIAFSQCPNGTYVDITIVPDQYPEETSWAVLKDNGDTLVEGGPYENIIDYNPQVTQLCVPNGNYTFEIYDTYGDGVAGSLWGGQDGSYFVSHCGDVLVEPDSANFGLYTYHGFTISDCAPPPPVYGCMDNNFVEFLPIATVDTGMCVTPRVFGCTDEEAFNYVDTANTDILTDSCTYSLTLTDLAGNGWAGAHLQVFQGDNFLGVFTLDNGFDTTFTFELSILEPVGIKFNTTQQSQFTSVQCGYSLYSDEDITIDEPGGFASPLVPFQINYGLPYCGDDCVEKVYGCTDEVALNYDDEANTDDSTCYYLAGCTNPIYLEYNSNADYDDSSCTTLVVLGCMDSTAYNYDPTANVELDGSCVPYVYGCMDPVMFNYDPLATAADTCVAFDYGCTDASMFNYNPNANTDNGSCIPFYYGCMDSTAINYDDDANADNGSCVYPMFGCNDPSAINYDPLVNMPDSSCEYSADCYIGDVYTLPNSCFAWVIEVDEYCCDVSWDAGCISLYEYCQDGWTGPTSLLELRNGLVTYPNPASDYIYINNKVDIKLFNILGDIIISKKQVNVLDVSALNPGVYNILIEYNNIKISKKIIKQ